MNRQNLQERHFLDFWEFRKISEWFSKLFGKFQFRGDYLDTTALFWPSIRKWRITITFQHFGYLVCQTKTGLNVIAFFVIILCKNLVLTNVNTEFVAVTVCSGSRASARVSFRDFGNQVVPKWFSFDRLFFHMNRKGFVRLRQSFI